MEIKKNLYQFTKKQLIDAFIEWNKYCLENPNDVCEIESTEEFAESQVNHLLSLIVYESV